MRPELGAAAALILIFLIKRPTLEQMDEAVRRSEEKAGVPEDGRRLTGSTMAAGGSPGDARRETVRDHGCMSPPTTARERR